MANGKKRYWLSFDLGLHGEYGELYSWLDRQQARECGDSVATFLSKKTRAKIQWELARLLDMKRNPRIYLIEMHTGGKFILGKRKVAPWTGYAQISVDSGEEK